jgi:single-strand DNA-binding protein
MAESVSKVVLIGNFGKDPEIRSLQSGSRIWNLSIAASESWRHKATGDREKKTEWHSVVIFNDSLVGVTKEFFRKGAKVYVEGQVETRKWQDQSGQDRYSTEVVIKALSADESQHRSPTLSAKS